MSRPVVISPSILSADFARLESELERIPDADWIHVDVMDGHFVPNLTIGAPVTKALARVTDKPLDCHLMIDDPGRWAGDYVAAGAASVTFHAEAVDDPVAIARELRAAGCGAGLSLKPGTPVEPYFPMLGEFDLILIMSVEPGFGGQAFMPEVLDKVRLLRAEIDRLGVETRIQIDGGISTETIEQAAAAGCDTYVAGSAVYGADDPNQAVRALRSLATR